jgi:hypothetical protein
MPSNSKPDARQDEAVRETFPASDPPASMSRGSARAVPAEVLFEASAPVPGAVTLRRRFADAGAAKLALESLVRDAPIDRETASIEGAELRLAVPPGDAERIRGLLQGV